MFVLVTGGSGSGKSEFAEKLSLYFETEEKYYIATMYPFDLESKERVRRHQEMRKEKHFQTLEYFINIKKCASSMKKDKDTTLLECVSNLLANEMYQESGAKDQAVEEIVTGICKIKQNTKNLIVVTNEVFSDGILYEEETSKYIKYLGQINQILAREAHMVIEVVYGIPIIHKGVAYEEIIRKL